MEFQVRKFECLSCKYFDYRMSGREIGEVVPNECPGCGRDMKVTGEKLPAWLTETMGRVSKYFEVSDFLARDGRVEAEVTARDPKRSFRHLLAELKLEGYIPLLRRKDEELRLMVVRYSPGKPGRVLINVLLLLLTLLTTFLASYFLIFEGSAVHAAMFSCSIMLLLGVHEMGHKIAAWRNGVESSLPYFIPAPPPFIGTAGAVINVKGPIPTREALVELGASGPLLGFLVALPITAVGLMLSKPDPEGLGFLFTPAIFGIIQILAFGSLSVGLRFNPLAIAGWLALLVTMLNLIPAGQLDGGHIARGLMSRQRHYILTRTLGFALFLIGFLFPELPFLVWGFLIILFFGAPHPGPLDDVSKVSKNRKLLAAAALIVFVLCLPVPAA
jgi:Zn-dependent protease